MTFEALDWRRLDRLRALFLNGQFEGESYWRDATDLAQYDLTLGERIGWKWDAVLRELKLRGWSPPAGAELWDWGCGSGVAGRRVLGAWPESFSRLRLTDHSRLAMEYAADRAKAARPGLDVLAEARSETESNSYVLCVSHVWNELPADAAAALRRVAAQAAAVLWVEPGIHSVARGLQAVREDLVTGAGHRVVAPCTHQAACGLLAAGNERHWCHHFADPPPEIFANSDWVRFGQRAGVDLRALPYAFLVTDRLREAARSSEPPDLQRVLGSPRVYKGFARVLFCGAAGVAELDVQQRSAPAIYKAWSKERGGDFYQVTPDPQRPDRAASVAAWPPT